MRTRKMITTRQLQVSITPKRYILDPYRPPLLVPAVVWDWKRAEVFISQLWIFGGGWM